MSHTVDDGFAMVDAARKANRIVQVGSQRVSSIFTRRRRRFTTPKARGRFLHRRLLGPQFCERRLGVIQSPDASEQTIDWNAFLEGAAKRPFDPVRFFRWRCFVDYGEGLRATFCAPDFWNPFITGTNSVAQRAQSAGACFAGKTGREFPRPDRYVL